MVLRGKSARNTKAGMKKQALGPGHMVTNANPSFSGEKKKKKHVLGIARTVEGKVRRSRE